MFCGPMNLRHTTPTPWVLIDGYVATPLCHCMSCMSWKIDLLGRNVSNNTTPNVYLTATSYL